MASKSGVVNLRRARKLTPPKWYKGGDETFPQVCVQQIALSLLYKMTYVLMVMTSLSQPSWIRHFGFHSFLRKSEKLT